MKIWFQLIFQASQTMLTKCLCTNFGCCGVAYNLHFETASYVHENNFNEYLNELATEENLRDEDLNFHDILR